MTKKDFIAITLKHYNDQLKGRQGTSARAIAYEADLKAFNACKLDIKKRLEVKLKNRGVCSDFLVTQLARHRCNLGELYSNKNEGENFQFLEYYNSSEILDIIELVESDKRSGELFKKHPLKGLYKIHHGSHSGYGYSLMLNIKNYWFNKKDELIPKREKELDQIIEKTGLSRISVPLNEMHTKAVASKDLTGEWIIYAQHNKINYFLCLALHNEGDENIFKNKIEVCLKEFPKLKQFC